MEVDGKTVAAGAGAFATLLGVLTRLLYGAIGHRITGAEQAAASAAAAAERVEARRREDSIDIHRKMDAAISRATDSHDLLIGALTRQGETLGEIHASLQQALGERPTRDEVTRLIQLHQGSKT